MATRKQAKQTSKAPRSEAQREQARLNGAKSRGPKTEAGKAVSRENAVTHGFSGKLLVGKGQRKVLNHRIQTFEAEAGPRAMHQGLAGFAAIAMTRAEAIGESRHKSAERNCRKIRSRERLREADLFDEGESLIAEGKHAEGLALLAEIPAGCMRIADRWFRLGQAAQGIEAGQPLAPGHWEEIDRLRSTIPPDNRPRIVAMLQDWRGRPDVPAARVARLTVAIAHEWEQSALERRDDLDQELDAKLANARADLGPKGQARERYFNKAHSIYRNAVQKIDAERRHRDRMRNEPEKSTQHCRVPDLVETKKSNQTGQPQGQGTPVDSSVGGMTSSSWACSPVQESRPGPDRPGPEGERMPTHGLGHDAHGTSGPVEAQGCNPDQTADDGRRSAPSSRAEAVTEAADPTDAALEGFFSADVEIEPSFNDPMRNEPENSTEAVSVCDVVKIDGLDQAGLSPGKAPPRTASRVACARPRGNATPGTIRPSEIDGVGAERTADAAPADGDEASPSASPAIESAEYLAPGTAEARADRPARSRRRGKSRPSYRLDIPGHPDGQEIPYTEVTPFRSGLRTGSSSVRNLEPNRSRKAESLPEDQVPRGCGEILDGTPAEPAGDLGFEERFGHLDPRNLIESPPTLEEAAEELARYRHLPGFDRMTAEAFLKNMRQIRDCFQENGDDPVEIDDVARYWAERGDPFAGGGPAPS